MQTMEQHKTASGPRADEMSLDSWFAMEPCKRWYFGMEEFEVAGNDWFVFWAIVVKKMKRHFSLP